MNALEELQNKPREKRTPLEQCIVDATTFEEAEHDGEIELMEQAAKDLEYLMRVKRAAQELAAQEIEADAFRAGLKLLKVLESKPK
jgi:hypothetical protein